VFADIFFAFSHKSTDPTRKRLKPESKEESFTLVLRPKGKQQNKLSVSQVDENSRSIRFVKRIEMPKC
jgi:hypothetical protein